jgi:hypothetical protein
MDIGLVLIHAVVGGFFFSYDTRNGQVCSSSMFVIMGRAMESAVPELGHQEDYYDEYCNKYRLEFCSAHKGSIDK